MGMSLSLLSSSEARPKRRLSASTAARAGSLSIADKMTTDGVRPTVMMERVIHTVVYAA